MSSNPARAFADRLLRAFRGGPMLAVLLPGGLMGAPAAVGQARVSIGPGTTVQAYNVGLTIGGTLEASGTFATRGTTLRFTGPDASAGLVLGNGLQVTLIDPQAFTPTVVSGPVQLQGVLRLDIAAGTVIPAGTSFTVLTCTGGCAGTFARVEAPFTAQVTYRANEVVVQVQTSSSVSPDEGANARAVLHAATPHPFGDTTTLRLDLRAASHVRADVYDLLGRNVETLHDGLLPAGLHLLVWTAHGRSAGTYVVRLRLDGAESGVVRPLIKR